MAADLAKGIEIAYIAVQLRYLSKETTQSPRTRSQRFQTLRVSHHGAREVRQHLEGRAGVGLRFLWILPVFREDSFQRIQDSGRIAGDSSRATVWPLPDAVYRQPRQGNSSAWP